MQTTGHLVAAAAELPSGVQLGEDQLHGGHLLAVALAGGDAAAVVDDRDATVGADGDVDAVGVAGQRLVDGVVDDLPDQVVQAALTGRPDVHAGTLADRFQSLEDLDRRGVIGLRFGRVVHRCGRGLRSDVGWGGPGLVGVGHGAPFVHRRP